MKNKLSALPNIFTLSNLFGGFLAIQYIFDERFVLASVLIIICSILDDLDGRMARWTNSYSEFGKQIDSIVDAISFGVVPALMVYRSMFSDVSILGSAFCFLYLMAGVYRLARFNVTTQGFKKNTYKGLPIPVAALTIATFILFSDGRWGMLDSQKVFMFLLPLVSLLMVSKVRFEPIPRFKMNRPFRANINPLIYLIGLVNIILFPKEAFFPWTMVYILKNTLFFFLDLMRTSDDAPDMPIKDDQLIK